MTSVVRDEFADVVENGISAQAGETAAQLAGVPKQDALIEVSRERSAKRAGRKKRYKSN
jgi:hypothetical protein